MNNFSEKTDCASEKQATVYESALKEYVSKAHSFEINQANLEADHRKKKEALITSHSLKKENLDKSHKQDIYNLEARKSYELRSLNEKKALEESDVRRKSIKITEEAKGLVDSSLKRIESVREKLFGIGMGSLAVNEQNEVRIKDTELKTDTCIAQTNKIAEQIHQNELAMYETIHEYKRLNDLTAKRKKIIVAAPLLIALVMIVMMLVVFTQRAIYKANAEEKAFLAKEASKGKILFEDDFRDNHNGWEEKKNSVYYSQISDGVLSMSVTNKLYKCKYSKTLIIFESANWEETNLQKPGIFYGLNQTPNEGPVITPNMIIEAHIKMIKGDDDRYTGIIIKNEIVSTKDMIAYAFMVNKRAGYKWVKLSFSKEKFEDEPIALQDDKNKKYYFPYKVEVKYSGVATGIADIPKIKTLKVVYNKYKVMLYCNESLLASFREKDVLNGKIGVIVERGLHVDFDDISTFSIADDR